MENFMKNVLYAVIAVLGVCVGVLFYQIQQLKRNISGASLIENKTENTSKPAVINTDLSKMPNAKIAFVNIDSLNEKYEYINDFVKVLKNKRLSLEGQLQNLTMKFQQDYEAAQQSAQAGIMPPAEIENKKRELERQQREIENKQIQMDKLAEEMQEKNDQLQKEVKTFLISFNNGKYDYIMAYTNSVPTILLANPELEITGQVLQALNADYRNKKAGNSK